ncbi:MAG: hypothetical protein IJ600_06760 [Lachnospiraceae bacterium]|nr:hypothetical protein [Lachnospiraceae bacterium]
MPKIEKRVLEWIDAKKEWFFVTAVTVAALLLRFPLRNILPGGMAGKAAAMLCDFLLALSAAAVVYLFEEDAVWKKRKSVLCYAAVLFSLHVAFASAIWGYGYSLQALFLIWSVAALLSGHSMPALGIYGVAVGLDPTALIMLPFLLYIYLVKKNFPILHFGLGVIPTAVMRLADAYTGGKLLGWYRHAAGAAETLYTETASFWAFLDGSTEKYREYAAAAVVIAVLVLAGLGLWLGKKQQHTRELFFTAFLFSAVTAFFWPGAAAGRAYVPEILSIVSAVFFPATFPLAVLFNMISIVLSAAALYGPDWLPLGIQGLSLAELAVLVLYVAFYARYPAGNYSKRNK